LTQDPGLEVRPLDVAIIGMAGRFPGAYDVGALWDLLMSGREGIKHFSEEELLAGGVSAAMLANPDYVRSAPVLDDIDAFDAPFFGLSPRDASILDPQQRLFLEHCWHALEDAAHDPRRFDGLVGVFGGAGLSTYMLSNLLTSAEVLTTVDPLQIGLGNERDSIATQVAYFFDLRGPCYTIQSYCSTSLVAVCAAATSLVHGECDMALAGGVLVNIPHRVGYMFTDGGLTSPDGHCRAFDADAEGTPMGNGVGVVAMRRLEDALADGDHIRAVLRGWAVNNDGGLKVGFTAPGVRGQSAVVAEAIASAGVDASTIDYIEAHGTGTPLGDSVEIAALQRVFGPGTSVALGSAKSNLGHLDRAAGVTGLIKTVLALEHGVIPQTLNVSTPNPQLLASDSLHLVTEATPWPASDHPRRAGVSAFGIGGTNAHVVVEQAPAPRPRPAPLRGHHPLIWSARSQTAACELTSALHAHLASNPDASVADAAFTLQTGRAVFEHRRCLIASSAAEAAADLADPSRGRLLSRFEPVTDRPVGLLIAGVGEQYPGMFGRIYATEPEFRDRIDADREKLRQLTGQDPIAALLGERGPAAPGPGGSPGLDFAALVGRAGPPQDADGRAAALASTAGLQPALFTVWHALAQMLRGWGIRPAMMLGYSLGEYVAACLSGVLSFDDALALVAHRAELIAACPPGAMAAIGISEGAARDAIEDSGLSLDVAGVNGPAITVVAGPAGPLDELLARLSGRGVAGRRLETTHAFHSRMLAGVSDQLTTWVRGHVTLHEPGIPYLSNVTGRAVTAAEVTDPGYWARHMCSPVRFADAVAALLGQRNLALLEIGPGQSLGSMVRGHPACDSGRWATIVASLPAAADRRPADAALAEALGRLWLAGVPVDWAAYQRGHQARRTPLPKYPFSRERHWVDPPGFQAPPATDGQPAAAPAATGAAPAEVAPAEARASETTAAGTAQPQAGGHRTWLRAADWQPAPAQAGAPAGHVLIFADDLGVGEALRQELAGDGARVTMVRRGSGFSQEQPGEWTASASEPEDHADVIRALADDPVTAAVHLWSLDATGPGDARVLGFGSVAALIRAVGASQLDAARLLIVTANAETAAVGDVAVPEAALVTGAVLSASQEYPSLTARRVDLPGRDGENSAAENSAAVGGGAKTGAAVGGAAVDGAGKTGAAKTGAAKGAAKERAGEDSATGGWARACARALRTEIGTPSADPLVAYRAGQRLTRTFTERATERPPPPSARPGGTYLITGGLGNIGLLLTEHLASQGAGAIILVSRRALPGREQWDTLAGDPAAPPAIAKIMAAERSGATVVVERADMTDETAMAAVIASARERFGGLDGVIHTATTTAPEAFASLATMNAASADLQFEAKVDGTLLLERLLADDPPGYCLLFSSISATLGGIGLAAYASANAFLSAVVHRNRAAGRRWIAVQWDTWAHTAESLSTTGLGASQAENSFSAAEGLELFDAALALDAASVVAGTGDLDARLRMWSSPAAEPAPAGPAAAARKPRPDLPQEFVPPATALERRLAALFSDVIGVDGVGTRDNFFDLSGTSLMGLQLLRRIRRELGVSIPAVALFEAPTVAALASYIGPNAKLAPEPAAQAAPAPATVQAASAPPSSPGTAQPAPPGPAPASASPGTAQQAFQPAAPPPAPAPAAPVVPAPATAAGMPAPAPAGMPGPAPAAVTLAAGATPPAPAALPATVAPVTAVTPAAAVAPAAAPASGRDAASQAAEDGWIAVIGMAGRFPGAPSVDDLWRRLAAGDELIHFFTEEELLAAGAYPPDVMSDTYVRARPILDDIRTFDAAFFGYSPRDASLTDPQQRLFLECSWEALENAGYGSPAARGRVGVFGGMNISTYLMSGMAQMFSEPDVSVYQVIIGNDKDALTTSVSYRLDLTGPAMTVQTFCSSSLVAVHLACQSLRAGECELALAGGVSIRIPDRVGHHYLPGGMESPDGHVRTFDADAAGSMFGDGSGVVVLKRFTAAQRDGDNVLAVIRGSAVNNDGARKVGFTAPSVPGQQRVIADALANAHVSSEDIAFIEAHGTATELGDPIEVAALTRAFNTERRQYCALGSIKSNLGHLDRAAGVTGLIKTVLSLHHGMLPPSLNFVRPNPEIDFENSPFFVNTELRPLPRWPGRPLIAGVSSLGMGGTNAHVVVQEAPPRPARRTAGGAPRRTVIIPVSARSAAAADRACQRLAAHLTSNPGTDVADVAWTMQAGRQQFSHRRVALAASREEAAELLAAAGTPGSGLLQRMEYLRDRPVAFVFSDAAPVPPGVLAGLAASEPAVAAALGSVRAVAEQAAGFDVVALLTAAVATPAPAAAPAAGTPAHAGPAHAGPAHAGPAHAGPAHAGLAQAGPAHAGPADSGPAQADPAGVSAAAATPPMGAAANGAAAARAAGDGAAGHGAPGNAGGWPEGNPGAAGVAAFLVAWAHATLLRPWLPEPVAVLGTGAGELAAACVAGLLPAADAIRAVSERARLLASAGTDRGAVAGDFAAWVLGHTTRTAPSLRLLPVAGGAVSGGPVAGGAMSSGAPGEGPAGAGGPHTPEFWRNHLAAPSRIGAALQAAADGSDIVFLVFGPGDTAAVRSAAEQECRGTAVVTVPPAAHAHDGGQRAIAATAAQLWLAGVPLRWEAMTGAGEGTPVPPPRRVPLPTYPFERAEHWVGPAAPAATPTSAPGEPAAALPAGLPAAPADPVSVDNLPRLPLEQWLYAPVWRQNVPGPVRPAPATWLVFADAEPAGFLAELGEALAARAVIVVRPGTAFKASPEGYTIRPGNGDDLTALVQALAAGNVTAERVLHLWNAGSAFAGLAEETMRGFHTLTGLARSMADAGQEEWQLDVVVSGAAAVLPGDIVTPGRVLPIGPVRIIPLEYTKVRARLIDIDPKDNGDVAARLARQLLVPEQRMVMLAAVRGGTRWTLEYDRIPWPEPAPDGSGGAFADEGVYLVTGGLGGIGLAMAQRLAREHRARLVLFGRTGLPPREDWPALLASPDTGADLKRRIEGVTAIASDGEVEIATGDVSSAADVRAAVELAIQRFGRLDGVVHAAGVPGVGLMQFKSRSDADKVLAPKVAGTLAIEQAIAGRGVGLLVLFSSVSSVTGGGPGQVDYCAANAFLDVYARDAAARKVAGRVVAIGWGEWTWNAWVEGFEGYDATMQERFQTTRSKFGIDFDEGWRAMGLAIAAGEPHVIVSTQDFAVFARLSDLFNIDVIRGLSGDPAAGRHPRPELSVPYVEPETEMEASIAALWASALGVEKVGVLDRFFELGGNSLIGVDLVARIRRELGLTRLPPHVLYEAPTVRAFAAYVGGQDGTEPDDEEARRRSRAARRRATSDLARGGSPARGEGA
jgi:acyl transferase domain-containing protein/acyl carrier protein